MVSAGSIQTNLGGSHRFPFPLGKASSDSSNLYFESGTAPKIGHFGRGRGESYSNRLASAVKSQDNSGKIESSRLEAIRKYEFDMRRKQWKRRLSHLKALCIVIILSYGTSPPHSYSTTDDIRLQTLNSAQIPRPRRPRTAHLPDPQRGARAPDEASSGKRVQRSIF